jgi:Restriction endonuclease
VADQSKGWRTYEEVATYLLNQMAAEFGLEKVVANQSVRGLRSGTKWTIEGKGLADGGDKFVIVECRRYPSSKLDQESVGGLAYRISDAGASGGIIVTPVGLQEGAARVAAAENITTVILDENSSSTDYIIKFLNKIKVGVSGQLKPTGTLGRKLIHKDGSVEDLGEV